MAPKSKQGATRQQTAHGTKDVTSDHDSRPPPAKKRRLRSSTVAPEPTPPPASRALTAAPRSARRTTLSGTTENSNNTPPLAPSARVPKQYKYDPEIWVEKDSESAFCIACNRRIKGGYRGIKYASHAETPRHLANLMNMKSTDASTTESTVTVDDPPITQSVRKSPPPPSFTAPITPASTPGPVKDTEEPTSISSQAKSHVINQVNGMRALWESHYTIPIGLNQLRISTTMARHTPLVSLIMGTPSEEASSLADALRAKMDTLGKVSKDVGGGLGDLLDAELVEMRRVQELRGDVTRNQERCNMLIEARKGAVELSELFNEMAYDIRVNESDQIKILNRVDQKLMGGTAKVEKLAEVMKGILSEALIALSHV